MTIFIASLFLPYTVQFEVPGSQPDAGLRGKTNTTATEHKAVSLFNPNHTIVQTPGATTDLEKIFSPYIERPFKLQMPTTLQRSPSLASIKSVKSVKATTPGMVRDPRSIPRLDTHSPAWGKAFNWGQPKSRAKSPPPSNVFHHNAQNTKEKTAVMLMRAANTFKSRARAGTSSRERRFSNDSQYTIERARIGNGGLWNAIDAVSESGLLTEKTWVGTLGMPTDDLDEHLKESIAERLEDDYESLSVMVEDGDFDAAYERYSKTILWPIFHYQIPDHPKSKAYADHSWKYYVKVNEAFADRIAKNYKKGDAVWVHDYHLMLLPSMLRARLPEAQIGFFMHTAFPSSEIFRVLANRADLLEGLLGSNMIGFQTEEYSHHFLQTCSRLLNAEATKNGVILEDGRYVHVNTLPIGIDPKGLDEVRSLPEVTEWIKTISEKYAGQRLIVSRDKLNNVHGVRQKLLAYELFLARHPEYRDKVVLIQIATSTTEEPELSALVADIVTRINSNHSTLAHQPIVFLRQDIDQEQYLALLTVAECLIITSLREGMNLSSHEYIYCQDGKHYEHHENMYGPLILSEFTGSATVFGNKPLLVNPWSYRQIAEAIKTALDMPLSERKFRWREMYASVVQHNATQWYTSFIEQLKHAWEEHSVRDSTSVPRLSLPTLMSKYEKANRRLLILDYEGTLFSWGSPTDIVLTTPTRLINILNDLVDDKKNIVYVMSSRMPEELERLFRMVPGLGLIAENGAFLMEAATDDWIELIDLDHVKSWKPGVRTLLRYFVDRMEGSKIEERHSTLIFRYADCQDTSGAFKCAGECANHINDACRSQNISAVPIDGGILVSALDLNKASAAAVIGDRLQDLSDDKGVPMPELLLVVGDSRDDEYVFSWAQELESKGVIRDVCTVTLGSRNTGASATLTQGVTGKLLQVSLF
jgi:trehalose 6-phosphate synthase complex regulatory subunit